MFRYLVYELVTCSKVQFCFYELVTCSKVQFCLNVKNEFMCGTRAVKGRPKLGVVLQMSYRPSLVGYIISFNRPRTDICFGTSCSLVHGKRQAR